MLKLSQSILEKVSFDSYLFNKELRKLILWLGDEKDDVNKLYHWCIDKFGNVYPEIIHKEFGK
jgi:hypothetical protein